MNLLEFIDSGYPKKLIHRASDGKLYIDIKEQEELYEVYWEVPILCKYGEALKFLSRYNFKTNKRPNLDNIGYGQFIEYLSDWATTKLNDIQIIADAEVEDFESYTKYPYYRMRGKRVKEAQAQEIIRRTTGKSEDIKLLHFNNHWNSEHLSFCQGWCHPSGIIGTNSTTVKYPNIAEILLDMLLLNNAFPYLDFVIALTDWENHPPYVMKEQLRIWDSDKKKDKQDRERLRKLEYSDEEAFMQHIVLGVWLHGQTIEFMEPGRAKDKYLEYEQAYSDPNKFIYIPGYYESIRGSEKQDEST